MKIFQTKSGHRITRVLGGRSNVYLIESNTLNVLVDTGKNNKQKLLFSRINNLEHVNGRIDILVLTHTHFDHCQNAHNLKTDYHCRIVMSQAENRFVSEGFTPLPKGTNPLTEMIIKLGSIAGKKRFGYQPFRADALINQEYGLHNLTDNISLLPTPGHSPGSISIIVDNEFAITGDAVFGIFRNSVFPPFGDDISQMIKSWKILLDTGCHTFLPGHGRAIKRDLLISEYNRYSAKYHLKEQ